MFLNNLTLQPHIYEKHRNQKDTMLKGCVHRMKCPGCSERFDCGLALSRHLDEVHLNQPANSENDDEVKSGNG